MSKFKRFFSSPKPKPAPVIPKGPSAEEIRAEEEAKIKGENLKRIQGQEDNRAKLRRAALADEDEEDAVSRKRLFGE